MLIEHKSSCYPEIKPRKRELCAPYNQLPVIRKMTYTKVKEIISEFDLESSEITDIRKEIKSLIKSVHPDSNGGTEFKDKISEVSYNKLMKALKFIDDQTMTITKNELSTVIKDLIPATDKKERSIELKNQINLEIKNFKKSGLFPRISTSAIAVVVSFIWFFPSTILEHPVLSEIIIPIGLKFTTIWIASLLLVCLVWLVTKRKERLMKKALSKLNLEMIQNKLFLKAISTEKYRAENDKEKYFTFTKDQVIEFFTRIEISGFKERYKYLKTNSLEKIKNFINGVFGIEQLLDIELAHSVSDIIIERLQYQKKISIIENENISITYKMNI